MAVILGFLICLIGIRVSLVTVIFTGLLYRNIEYRIFVFGIMWVNGYYYILLVLSWDMVGREGVLGVPKL